MGVQSGHIRYFLNVGDARHASLEVQPHSSPVTPLTPLTQERNGTGNPFWGVDFSNAVPWCADYDGDGDQAPPSPSL